MAFFLRREGERAIERDRSYQSRLAVIGQVKNIYCSVINQATSRCNNYGNRISATLFARRIRMVYWCDVKLTNLRQRL